MLAYRDLVVPDAFSVLKRKPFNVIVKNYNLFILVADSFVRTSFPVHHHVAIGIGH